MQVETPPLLASLRRTLFRIASTGLASERWRDELPDLARRLRDEAGHGLQAQRLADALERCARLSAAEAAAPLMRLLVAMQQLGSDVPARVPEPPSSAPLPESSHRGFPVPLAPELLLELRAALTRQGQAPRRVLELLTLPQVVEDPRTWPLLEAALAHPFLREAAVPALIRVPAMRERIRERFNRRGGAADAARLRVLVGMEERRCLPLLQRAARGGSVLVQRAALELLAGASRAPAEAREALVLDAFDTASPEERAGMARALALLGTDPALQRLLGLAAIGAVPNVLLREHLDDAARSRFLALFERAPRSTADTSHLFQLLEGWEAPEVHALLWRFLHAPEPRLRRQAAEVLLGASDGRWLEPLAALGEEDAALTTVGVAALLALGPDRAFTALLPRLEAWDAALHDAAEEASPPEWVRLAYQSSAVWPHAGWTALRERLAPKLEQAPGTPMEEDAPLQPAPIRARKDG